MSYQVEISARVNRVMPFSYTELERFYEGLVARARSRGIGCAITSGMACVAFGVSEATKGISR